MLKFATLTLLSATLATNAFGAATVFYDGVNNTASATGPAWVVGTNMYTSIIKDYTGSTEGSSGAAGIGQTGFDIFTTGGFDVTNLFWEIGIVGGGNGDPALSLLTTGVGDSVTVSPGVSSEGKEDYRYDTTGAPAHNLVFFYDDPVDGVQEWVSGYIERFVVTVANNTATTATGLGEVTIVSNTADGQTFFDEIMALSGGTGEISYVADSFNPVSAGAANGTFTSVGSFTVVPEPSTWAAIFGVAALGIAVLRRRLS